MADGPANDAPFRLIDQVEFGDGVIVGPSPISTVAELVMAHASARLWRFKGARS